MVFVYTMSTKEPYWTVDVKSLNRQRMPAGRMVEYFITSILSHI